MATHTGTRRGPRRRSRSSANRTRLFNAEADTIRDSGHGLAVTRRGSHLGSERRDCGADCVRHNIRAGGVDTGVVLTEGRVFRRVAVDCGYVDTGRVCEEHQRRVA